MIGSLLYLTTSRPDIMFNICLSARFQSKPKESHLKPVKMIFKYLSGTSELGLFYPCSLTLVLNADYACSQVDRKSIIGACKFLGESLVAWHINKQTLVSISTSEGKYLAA